MAIVARVTAGSVVVAVRSWAALWRLLGWSRMGLVGLVVVVVVHGVSMMPSRPRRGRGVGRVGIYRGHRWNGLHADVHVTRPQVGPLP